VENDALTIAAVLCRRFEGLYLRPYMCPAGVPTIGYGSTRYENGVRVSLQDAPITKQRAEALLLHELKNIKPEVLKLCLTLNALGSLATAAIVDFTFNLGTGRLRASTLRKKINAKDIVAARIELGKWVRGGGKVLPGLVKRRAAEAVFLR
jgi:lysozyme